MHAFMTPIPVFFIRDILSSICSARTSSMSSGLLSRTAKDVERVVSYSKLAREHIDFSGGSACHINTAQGKAWLKVK